MPLMHRTGLDVSCSVCIPAVSLSRCLLIHSQNSLGLIWGYTPAQNMRQGSACPMSCMAPLVSHSLDHPPRSFWAGEQSFCRCLNAGLHSLSVRAHPLCTFRSRKGTARLDDPYTSGQHLKLGVSSTGSCQLELLGHNGACAAPRPRAQSSKAFCAPNERALLSLILQESLLSNACVISQVH